jgi:hypothetical protein
VWICYLGVPIGGHMGKPGVGDIGTGAPGVGEPAVGEPTVGEPGVGVGVPWSLGWSSLGFCTPRPM